MTKLPPLLALLLVACSSTPPTTPSCQTSHCVAGSTKQTYATCGDTTSPTNTITYEFGGMTCAFQLDDTVKTTSCAEAVGDWCQGIGLDQ